jgi:hypothetical protein
MILKRYFSMALKLHCGLGIRKKEKVRISRPGIKKKILCPRVSVSSGIRKCQKQINPWLAGSEYGELKNLCKTCLASL